MIKKLITLFFVFISTLLNAQTYYVRAGATGLNNGSDWNNAFNTLPNSPNRGAIYYVANGNYGDFNFNTPASGTNLIIIKKATISDHGTSTGWQNIFSNQAVWSSWSFSRPYIIMDGQVRDSNWAGGYGFKVIANGDRPVNFYNGNNYASGNITIRYTDVEGMGLDNTTYERLVYGIFTDNIKLQYCYFHDTGSVPVVTGSSRNWLMEYCLVARNSSNAFRHAEGWAGSQDSNIIIRFNRFEDIEGTGQIVALGRGGNAAEYNDNWEIYGNTFFYTPGNPHNREGSSDGAIAVINNQIARNWKIYNNTFINMQLGLSARIAIGNDGATGHTAEIKNNFWWSCKQTTPNLKNGTYIVSHNRFDDSIAFGDNTEINSTALTSVFINYSNKDFRLSSPTTAGFNLPAPYNVDFLGNTRGLDNNFDKGAYEYIGNVIVRPLPPLNLRLVNN